MESQPSSAPKQEHREELRDVTSTARLFNFSRPVFLTPAVWDDCVAVTTNGGELTALRRLRHLLFMASSALRNQVQDLECDFRIHRVANNDPDQKPEPVNLRLIAHTDNENQPIITIKFPDE